MNLFRYDNEKQGILAVLTTLASVSGKAPAVIPVREAYQLSGS